ncbi:MAG: pirin family protein [Spirochaetia bacterium]|nr:pirin family protein [Spirochaetia bacterium]
MKHDRTIKEILWRMETSSGAGIPLYRGFGFREVPRFDPFLLFEELHPRSLQDVERGFPRHPCRGFETITYMSSGALRHTDSLGTEAVIRAGEVLHLCAGSGIMIRQIPQAPLGGTVQGFFLWMNLPAHEKLHRPSSQLITVEEIPELSFTSGLNIRLIAGDVSGIHGPLHREGVELEFLDIRMPAQTTYTHPTRHGHCVFAYVIEGEGYFSKERNRSPSGEEAKDYLDPLRPEHFSTGAVILYDAGDQVTFSTNSSTVRFLLISGRPIGEPLAWYGPVVMSTRSQLEQALQAYGHR